MNAELQILRDFIKSKGLKRMSQGKTILKAFLVYGGHVDNEMLFEKARDLDPSIVIATVCRKVTLLKECGLASEHALPGAKKV